MGKSKYVFKNEGLYRRFVDCEIFKDFIKQLKNSEYFNDWFFRKDLNPANYKYLFDNFTSELNSICRSLRFADKYFDENFTSDKGYKYLSKRAVKKFFDLDKKENK